MNDSRILVVDDSYAALKIHKKCLSSLNAHITTAVNGKEGLKKALSVSFDLIITDLDMPEMDGIDFCKSLKRIPETRDIPVIIASTFDSEKNIEKGFIVGASAFLSKKEIGLHLKKTVENILWKKSFIRKRKILIVDDSSTIRETVENGLRGSGFNIITATNGKIALAAMHTEKPDLILCDINMPEINGFELCKLVKQDTEFADVPFIVMSGNNDKSHMNRMIQYGVSAYIVKPFNIDQLIILIERILSDHFLIVLKEKERLASERSHLLDSIASLVSALEARDAYTKGHSIAVSRIASEMLALMGASKKDIDTLKIAGRLHDIGKIGVMDRVLLKTGKLTEEEFNHIKQHPTIGRKILQPIPSLSDILPVVYCHHERWDGGGYPEGLKGNQIPFWARITAVADTFHALTSDRPYRKGIPYEKAFQIIQEVKRTQLCPESVNIFFDWVGTKGNEDRFY
jgi:response regulator RpfG family c-di-GMP phosphodiesterase